jgi:hypothetical protein
MLLVHDIGTNELMWPHLSRGMCGDVLLSNATCWHLFGSVDVSFFLLVKGVPIKDEWFVTCSHFFNSFFSLSSPKSTYWSSLLCLFQSHSLFFLFLFFSWSFYKNFVCFEFSSSIIIYRVLFFPIQSLFFWFLICILGIFIKVLLIFNFIF